MLNNFISKRDDQSEQDRVVEEASRVYNQNPASEDLSIEYLKILKIYMFKHEDTPELKNKVNQAKVVYDQSPSENRAYWYLAVLDNFIWKRDDKSEQAWVVSEASRVYNQSPSENRAYWYLAVLNNFISKRDNQSEQDWVVSEASRVYNQNPASENLSIEYLKVLNIYMYKQEDSPELKNKVNQAKVVYDQSPSENRACWYLSVLNNYIWKRDDKSEQDWAVEEAGKIYEENPASENLSIEYLKVLNTYMNKHEDSLELKNKVNQAKVVYDQSPSENRAYCYLAVLNNYIWKRDDQSEQDWAVEEASRAYNQNPASENLSIEYLKVLSIYMNKQEESPELKNKLNQAEVIYEQSPSENRAYWYLAVLNNYMKKQGDQSEQDWAVEKAREIYQQYQSSNNIASIHLWGLIGLTKELKDLDRMKEFVKLISSILRIYPQLSDLVVKHIDQLLFNKNDYSENCTKLLMYFAEEINVKDYLMQTKYGILFDSNEIPTEELKILVQIFSLVQRIKNDLIIKKPKELTFGHYTSAKVLQLLLKQKEGKEKYAIENRSRLSNVNYMNDPSEGKVLNQFLELDIPSQKISLKASPWFLMSLTTEIDRLEMWAQYGKQAEGVCLVLDPSDFLKVNSYSDMEWITAKRSIELPDTNLDNNRLEEVTSEIKLIQGDYIYRIGYLSFSDENGGLLSVEDNKELISVIDNINDSLISLRKKVQETKKNKILYEKVDECLEEIRYLFKSADYKYEKELRVLKFIPLDSNDSKIKIDYSEETAKLYIERDNPIQIAKVIFGPKFSKPEDVTPLLYLLDKNIKFRQSKIPFK